GERRDRRGSIHIIAIGGTGVAPLACLLKQEGYQVRGSDGPLYPPMSDLLAREGIRPLVGFDPRHLHPRPDLVIVGNAVPRSNPEVEELERLGWPKMSMPEALGALFLAGRAPVVVAGTHGKTTTTAMAAWVYSRCGEDPGYLVGGLPRDLPSSFAKGSGRRFLIEGDEYNAAYFDRGPKFLHYRPETVILTGVEHDHVDLYPDPESFLAAFRSLLRLLPSEGLLIADGDAPGVRELAAAASCRVRFYGLGPENDVRPLAPPEASPAGTRLRILDQEEGEIAIELGVPGMHNVRNALAVWALARRDRLPLGAVREALSRFRGVHRRLECVGEARGVTVIDDFAHHPTEIEATLGALRQRFPGRRLIAVFEPRSLTSGRSFFLDDYLRAFGCADAVHLAPIFHARRLSDEERLDLGELVRALASRGVDAAAWESVTSVLDAVLAAVGPGDVVVTMSSGSFEGVPHRILEGLDAAR
ncbi:MAG TPA: Mur ligase family protein, partial [Thermoanaerobaculia bacterium]|nr:Mur ligase family protein [Thermoanaerobaculia bacterium]